MIYLIAVIVLGVVLFPDLWDYYFKYYNNK